MRTRILDRALRHLLPLSHTLAQRLTFNVDWTLDGVPLRVPFLSGVGAQNLRVGPNDIALYRVLRHVLPRTSGAVIDVGCNIGHFMELCVLVERARRYVGFDISLSCCYYLERFIRESRLPAHYVFPVALSNREGVAAYHANSPFDVCASLKAEAHQAGRYADSGMVLVETGDRILGRLALEDIALIKVDVEGQEWEVLEGLDKTVAAYRPYLVFEVLIYAHLTEGDPQDIARVADERRATAKAIERFCRERDYLVYKMQQDGALTYRPRLDPGTSVDAIAMDHLALPREKADALLRDYPLPIDIMPQAAAAA